MKQWYVLYVLSRQWIYVDKSESNSFVTREVCVSKLFVLISFDPHQETDHHHDQYQHICGCMDK